MTRSMHAEYEAKKSIFSVDGNKRSLYSGVQYA